MMLVELLEALIFPGFLFTIGLGFLFDWLERKVGAHMQGRIGPLVAGPHGLFQPVADFLKLLYKEEIVPSFADVAIYRIAPSLFFLAPILGMLFVPVIGTKAVATFDMDLLFVVFLLAYSAFVVVILSFSSASGYTTVASGRLVLQYVSYEIPLVIATITAAVFSGSLSLAGIVESQSRVWNVLYMPFSFIVYIVAMMAELEKPPFDIPSAKTEIVAGWLTEFSGRSLAFLKLTKEVSLVFGGGLAVALFLGGPLGPMPANSVLVPVVYGTYFLLKLLAIVFLVFVLRTALARLKIAQAAELFWKILTPLALAQLALVIVLKGV
ncbi:NADH-quinone oxidoreductase subunit H [Candidatus Bathyarchaeota archaeon]|jgi:NADH-quinone oxidoreductase subunit H|nr:NADH-quinone oxidoreductase subunit H [Candidatus Bathyarchaeota archaeon]